MWVDHLAGGRPVQLATMVPVAPPAQWRTQVGPTTPVAGAWWTAFGDPELSALVERALANNDDLAAAAARVREARSQLDAAHALQLPTVDVSTQAFRDREVDGIGTPVQQYAAIPEVRIAYEVDLWGRIADQNAAARASFMASQTARDALRLSLSAEVAKAYITLLSLDLRLAVVKQTLAARGDELRLARSRVEAGYSARLELAQAQAEYQSTALIVPQLEAAITHQEDAISLLIGQTPSSVLRTGSLSALIKPPAPEGLPSELLRRRPDVAEAEFRLAATDHALAVARKNFLPKLNLTASAGIAYSTAIEPNPIDLWGVGGSILAPIFEGGRLKAEAGGAAARRDAAAFGYRKTTLVAFKEVEDALASVYRLDQQAAVLHAQHDALAEELRLATNRFRNGYSSYLEQLDAQRALLGASLSLAQADADALVARVDLYQAMGGGWSGALTIATQ